MRKALVAVLTFIALGAPSTTVFAKWPERPVQMVVPFPAGGLIDVVARKFAEPLSARLGKPVVVIDRDGASGVIGTGAVARSTDDYTIGLVPSGPLVIQPLLRRNSGYKTSDLKPICQIFSYTYVLAVRADSPYNSLHEFVEAAKKSNGSISLGYIGPGAAQHFVMLQLSEASGAKFLGVPYRGDPPVALALKSGDLQAAILTDEVARPQGFKVLAVAAASPLATFPGVPTMREQGFDVVVTTYAGIVAPASISPEAVQALQAACGSIMRSEDFQNALKKMKINADFLDREQFESTVHADTEVKRQLIEASDIKIE